MRLSNVVLPFLGAVLTIGATSAARGQTTGSPTPAISSDVSTPAREEIVVTGQTQVPLAAPYTEGLITADEIRNLSPAPTVTAQTLLNTQPSIFAYTDGPLGTRTNVYFRAFNADQFAETYDGVSLNDVFNGSVTNQASNINNVLITPNGLDGVNVYRGINNPLVNSYNSLGGTIDYTPRRPGNAFGGEVGISYGSFNTLQWHATVNSGDYEGLKQMLSFEHGQSDGWNANTADRNNNLYYSATYDRENGDQLGVYFLYNDNTGYTPFNMPVPLLQQNGGYYQWPKSWTYEFDTDTNWMAVVDYKAQLADDITLQNKVFGGYNNYQRTSYSNPLYQQSATQPYVLENTPSGYPFWLSYPNGPFYDPGAVFGSPKAGTDYHFYGYAAWGAGDSPTLTITLPHNVISIGGNFTYGELHSREYWYGSFDMPMTQGYNDAWDEHDNRIFASVFVQDEIALLDDQLHVTPGVKFIYAQTQDHDAVGFYYPISGSVSDVENFIAPTIGVNYALTKEWAAYAAFGQNLKFPDIGAFYGAFQSDVNGNPVIVPVKVSPEHVNDYEIGVRYQHDGFSGSVDAYREDFTNTFVNAYDPNSGLTTTTNGGSSRYQGVELQLKQDFGQMSWGDLNVYLNYAHNEAKFTSSFVSDYAGQVQSGQPLANVPEDLVSLGATWQADGWRVDVAGRYVGRQYIDQLLSGTPSSNVIKSFVLVDLGIAKTIPVNNLGFVKQIRLALNVNNLLDRYYYNEAYTDQDYNGNSFIRAVPGAPRSITGSLSASF